MAIGGVQHSGMCEIEQHSLTPYKTYLKVAGTYFRPGMYVVSLPWQQK